MRTAFPAIVLLIISCAATYQPGVTPQTGDSSEGPRSASAPTYQIWADGRFAWDSSTQELVFVPARVADAHFNVWPLLNPPKCNSCVSLQVLSHDPVAKLLTVNVTLTNPTGLSGWFVRGLVIPEDDADLEVLSPDGWWHSLDMPVLEPPPAFMIFAGDQPDREFGPHETYSAIYQFRYASLSVFAKCEYQVLVRYPKEPGEVSFLGNGNVHGALTKSGGFISARADMEADATCPETSMQAQWETDWSDFSDWHYLRIESGNTYLTWFPGIATASDTARLWIYARMVDSKGCALVYRIDLPILDATGVPNRVFPPAGTGGAVFVDQLSTQMTDPQKEFMATHCVGSQKLVKSLADSMRVYNPDFIVIQYHLAFGAGDLANIVGNDWVSNWTFENAQEDFFEHRSWSTQPNQRVLQQDWNWYLTDPTSEWALYFIGNTIERMDPLGDQFDGVFADSASQPWNTDPEKWWEGSDDPYDMFTYWTPKTQYFFDTVAQAYHTLPVYYYLIPNAGSYVTTISDITYNQCDGVMIEGFCHWGPDNYFTEEDWRLQMNRARSLAIQNKIILCQTDVDVDNIPDRRFVHGTYMLLLDNYTYLNMLGPWGLEPQWWPEYSWDPGPAVEDWVDIGELQDSGGCYVRTYENGIVIVNPSDEVRYFTTTKMYSHSMFAAGGLLPEDGVPTGVGTGPIVGPGVQEIAPHSTWLGAG